MLRLRQGAWVVLACGFVPALACTGEDESKLARPDLDSPPRRVIGTALPSAESADDPMGTTQPISGASAPSGGPGTGPSTRDDDPSDSSGPPIDVDGGHDASDSGASDAEPICENGSFRCPGSLTTQCFLPRDGFGLAFDCRSEAACAEAISQCEPGDGGACPAEQCCRLAAQIPEGPGVFSVSTGRQTTCALVGGGAIRCWGFNLQGQLGYGHVQNIGDTEFPYLSGDLDLGEPAIQVVAGAKHTCALLATGAVRCWGDAKAGKLGFGDYERAKWIAEELEGRTVDVGDDETARLAPRVELGAPAVQLAAGAEFTCALLVDGSVRCWGQAGDGKLGVPSSAYQGNIGDRIIPACAPAVDLGGSVEFIASGHNHTCAILEGGSVRCFGDGYLGKLGYGSENDVGDDETPASAGDVRLDGTATWLSAGPRHTCAVLDDGSVRCWGAGQSFKLGYDEIFDLGDDELPAALEPLDLGAEALQVAAGHEHTCALLANGAVRCWGSNTNGELGDPRRNRSTRLSGVAERVDLGAPALAVDSEGQHTCAVVEGQRLICWGDNDVGALGYGNTADVGDEVAPAASGFVPVLTAPPGLPPDPIVDPIDAGPPDLPAADAAGTPDPGIVDAAPGDPIPDPAVADARAPEPPAADAGPAEPVCETGAVRCERSLLSICNAERTAFEPTRDCATSRACERARPSCDRASCIPEDFGCLVPAVPVTSRIQSVSTGDQHACALLAGGRVRCWGDNQYGQLGYGHTNNLGDDETAAAAGDVQLGEPALSVVAGGRQTCVIFEGGRVRCWGDGSAGRLGRGDTISIGDTEVPDASTGTLQLGGKAIQLSAGSSFTCALLENGDVRCWGLAATDGKLGVPGSGNIGDLETPAEVAPVDLGGPALFIASGSSHSCAILDNERRDVRCWGQNRTGQLGYEHSDDIGQLLPPASQPPVALDGRAVHLSLGVSHSCAVLEGGTVRCWGDNLSNKLGYVSALRESTQPLARPALEFGQPALQVAAGQAHTCALLRDLSVRCWGTGADGRLGAGIELSANVPLGEALPFVDVGGESVRVDAGSKYTCALLGLGQLSCWGNGTDGSLGHGKVERNPGFRIGDDETPAVAGFVPLF